MPLISAKKWESKAAFLAHMVEAGERTATVGKEAEAPRRFYSFAVPCEDAVAEVGVLSSGLGTEPAVALICDGKRLVIGHDMWTTWIDLAQMSIISSCRLNGVFYEFISLGRDDQLLVVHELGALRVDADGGEIWAVHTDVVEHAAIDEQGNLVLNVMDHPARIVVSLASGRRV